MLDVLLNVLTNAPEWLQQALIALSALPIVLGNASIGEETEDDLDLDFDDLAPATPAQAAEQPFLAVDERTTYKTREDAIKGISEAGARIARYSQFGSPEQIEAERAELQRLRQAQQNALQAFGGPEPKKPGALDNMPPDQRTQFETFHKTYDPMLAEAGYVRREDVDRMVQERIPEIIARERQNQAFTDLATARLREIHGDIDPGILGYKLDSLVNTAIEIAEAGRKKGDPLGKEIADAWNRNDPATVLKKVEEVIYGDLPGRLQSRERERDENGKFKSAADYDRTKERTGKLPKAPPAGQAAAVNGEDEAEQRRRLSADPAARKKRLAEIMFGES